MRALTEAVRREVERLPWLSDALGFAVDLTEVYVEVQVEDAAPGLGRASGPAALAEACALEPRRWLLLGPAGSGKSTLLRKLASEVSAQDRVPAWLHADDLAGARTLRDAVDGRYALGDEADAARRAGRLVLLVDGLDEATDREATRVGLEAVVRTAGGCPVVVATRDVAPAELPGFGRLIVRPLEPARARELWGRFGVPTAAWEALARRARGWADSPTLLTLAAAVVRAEPAFDLPARRADLYARALEVILRREFDAGRGAGLAPEALAALEDVVLAFHGTDGFTRAELDEALEARGHPDCAGALLRSGLVHEPLAPRRRPLGPAPAAKLCFPHRTLAEWVGSAAVPRTDLDALLARAAAAPERWAELLALAVSRACARDRAAGVALFDRVNALGVKALSFRVVAEAEGLPAESVLRVMEVGGAREDWERRSRVLRELPALVGDPAVAVDVYLRFAHGTRHGADLWWAGWGLRRLAEGGGPEAMLAREGLGRLYEHIPASDRGQALALMAPWWRTIPAGEGWMGSPEDEPGRYDDEGPRRRVRLEVPFELLGVPVTQAMYRCFDPRHVDDDDGFHGALSVPNLGEVPVYRVSWFEAAAFADWLGLALPTEAAWEYACRAGSETRWSHGDAEEGLAEVAWYAANSRVPRAVGGRTANGWGLHDMNGNVFEWCADAWTDTHARRPEVVGVGDDAVATNPIAGRVVRGGSFDHPARDLRSAYRNWGGPQSRSRDLGFRLVRPPRPPRP